MTAVRKVGTMLEELDQNSRRRWNWHRYWCIQSFDSGSAATFRRSLYIEGVDYDIPTSRDGRQRRNPNQRLDLPADDLQIDYRIPPIHQNAVAGCAAFHH